MDVNEPLVSLNSFARSLSFSLFHVYIGTGSNFLLPPSRFDTLLFHSEGYVVELITKKELDDGDCDTGSYLVTSGIYISTSFARYLHPQAHYTFLPIGLTLISEDGINNYLRGGLNRLLRRDLGTPLSTEKNRYGKKGE